MTLDEVLHELQAAGSEQTRKTYARHGVGETMFGVSYAKFESLRKQIKRDHMLAKYLWATGNHDARVLATMIADPAQMDRKLLDSWVKDLRNYPITDAFARLAAATPHASDVADSWIATSGEWTCRAGWIVLALTVSSDTARADAEFDPYLSAIEAGIHLSKNRVRDAMNAALIAIGSRNDATQAKALAAAARIGKVEVDHGETGCKTPDAAEYIRKVRERQAKKRSKPTKKGRAG